MRNRFLASSLVFIMVLSSCARRPLDILATSVSLRLINDYSFPFECRYNTPEHYRVNMYDEYDGHLVYRDFVTRDGGGIKAVPGHYLCFVCNYDTQKLTARDEDNADKFYISAPVVDEGDQTTFLQCNSYLATKVTDETSAIAQALSAATSDADVLRVDEYLYSGKNVIDIPYLAETDDELVYDMDVASAMHQTRLVINNVTGIEYISSVVVYMTNFASGIYPVTGVIDPAPATMMFNLYLGDEERQLAGVFAHFGLTQEQKAMPHMAYVLITDTAGGRYLYVYDVTAVIQNADDTEITITIPSEIIVPEPTTSGGGGFAPKVDDWAVEYFEIPLGQGK